MPPIMLQTITIGHCNFPRFQVGQKTPTKIFQLRVGYLYSAPLYGEDQCKAYYSTQENLWFVKYLDNKQLAAVDKYCRLRGGIVERI